MTLDFSKLTKSARPAIPLWLRLPQDAEWHSGRFDALITAVLQCSQRHVEVFTAGLGVATLPIDTDATFGPVCAACARLEGFGG